MLEKCIKFSLWLFITQFMIQGVSLEKSCPDYIQYYCACSLADIAEVKQIKMCLYEDLEKVGCHPCPERLQENVNCNSCSNDACPICSLRKFGSANLYGSHIKQQVFIKFAPHQGIFYIQPMQDYPGFGAEQNNELHHISTYVSGRNNQTLSTNNHFPKLQEALEGFSLDNMQRNVDLFENIDENASNVRGRLHRNGIKWDVFPKQDNFQTNLKSFRSQGLMHDRKLIQKPLNMLETVKNDEPLKQLIAKLFNPEFTLPEIVKDLTNLNDSDFYEVHSEKSKNSNEGKQLEKYRKIKPLHYLPSDEIKPTTLERFIKKEPEHLEENLENDLTHTPLHTSGNEFKIKTFTGDKQSWRKKIDDTLKHAENETKSNNLLNDWIKEINNILELSDNDNDGFKRWISTNMHDWDNNNELQFSDDETESGDLAERWLEESEFSNDKFKNNGLIKKSTKISDATQSFPEYETQNNESSDNLPELMLNNNKTKISDYKVENNDEFKYETEQEFNNSFFSDKNDKINEFLESWTPKGSELDVFDYVIENFNGSEDLKKAEFKKKQDMENETESRNSFKNSMDKIILLVTRPEEKLIPLLDNARITNFPNTESQNTTNFRLERVYRDIPRFSVWSKDYNKPDEIGHKSILKLYTLDPGRVYQNFSDVLWFRYREYIETPQINKPLQSRKLKNSEIFKILNVSISSLKKSEMYISNCETCSVIYKLMLDSGFKNGLELTENDNSSVIVLMDKPQFVLHHNKLKLPGNSPKKWTKNNNAFIIQMNIDLLFLTSDDYKKLSQRNASETNILSNSPWRDLKKKSSLNIPESFFLQSKIWNLSKSLARKDLKTFFKESMNMGQLTEELRKITFVILSKMHKHKTTAIMKNINISHRASMILPTFNPEMTKIKVETGHSDGNKNNKGISKIKAPLRFEKVGEKTEFKPDAVDYKENGSSSNLKKIKEVPHAFEEKGASESGGNNFKKIFRSGNLFRLIVTEHSENTSYKDKGKAINGSFVKISLPENSPNDDVHTQDKDLKSIGLKKKLSLENGPIENSGKSETNANYSFEILKSENEKSVAKTNPKQSLRHIHETAAKTNDVVGLKDDLNAVASQVENRDDFKYSPSEISRVKRSLRNLDPVIHFRLTDKGILNRKRRQAARIPHNHWCTIMSMRRNGNLDCTIWTFKKKCKLECHPGYSYGGSQTVEMNCVRRGNAWKPDINRACSGSGPIPERPRPDRPGPKRPNAMHGPDIYDDYDITGRETEDNKEQEENFTDWPFY